MLSQDSDSFLDDGDDLVAAFLEEEAKATTLVKQVEPVQAAKRSRQRSTSPVQAKPRNLDVKPEITAPKQVAKRTRADRSPSIEVIEVRTKKIATIKPEAKPVSPIVVVEPAVSWPPTKVPASDVIKQAHSTHRKYLQASSAISSSASRPASASAVNSTQTQCPPKSMVTLHPSLTDSRQATLKSKAEDFDEEMKPVTTRKKGLPKLKGKDVDEEVILRDERGNLTEKGKRALDKKVLGTFGQEENAITNSDLYSRTQHIISSATGHQVSNGGAAKYSISGRDYNMTRNQKLRQQSTANPQTIDAEKSDKETFVLQSKIFAGCTMWLNGYSGNKITDMELKKLIAMHGGMVSLNEGSRITHVLVSERISGSKAEKFLRGVTKAFTKNGKKKVVLVDWVLDSIREGKKLSEAAYHVIENESQPTIVSRFGFSSVVPSSTPVVSTKSKKGNNLSAEVICLDD